MGQELLEKAALGATTRIAAPWTELFEAWRREDWIATTHYGDRQARLIGERLGDFVEEVLASD